LTKKWAGAHGAQKIAAFFQEQGLTFDYVLDEAERSPTVP